MEMINKINKYSFVNQEIPVGKNINYYLKMLLGHFAMDGWFKLWPLKYLVEVKRG